MNDAWRIARCNFTDDDGSLPGIEFRNLQPSSVQRLWNYFSHNGDVTTEDATFWHHEMQADVPLNQFDDPAGLVVTGIAAPFHCCFQLKPKDEKTIPVLGLFVLQDVVEIDFRMGSDWCPENVDAFFRLLVHLKSIAPESQIESAANEGLRYPLEFKAALDLYTIGDEA
jgi:hypothetical protein